MSREASALTRELARDKQQVTLLADSVQEVSDTLAATCNDRAVSCCAPLEGLGGPWRVEPTGH